MLAVIAGAVLLGVGVISVWMIVREGSPANASPGKLRFSPEATPANEGAHQKTSPAAHKPPKPHKH
jgi:hypothetical protein